MLLMSLEKKNYDTMWLVATHFCIVIKRFVRIINIIHTFACTFVRQRGSTYLTAELMITEKNTCCRISFSDPSFQCMVDIVFVISKRHF